MWYRLLTFKFKTMKKLFIILLLGITLYYIGCDKKSSSSTYETSSSATEKKCPNCGSVSLKSLEPGGNILECNSCGIAFNK